MSFQTWQNNEGRKDSTTVWNEMIAARVAQEGPWPATVADRELLIKRVTQDLGIALPQNLSEVERQNDDSPDCLAKLTARLQEAGKSMHFAGELSGGETKFRVTAADPDAAKKPRTASNPGQYTLNENARLVVTRRPIGERIVNEAAIRVAQPEPEAARPPGPCKIELPAGDDTWAAAWVRGGTVMWVQQKGLLRRLDFSKIAIVEETRYEGDKAGDAPISADIREALRVALAVPVAPKQIEKPVTPAPAAPASEAPAAEKPKGASAKIVPDSLLGFWKGVVNGEAINLSFHRPPADSDVQCDLYLGEATIGAPMAFKIAPDGRSVTLLSLGRREGGEEYAILSRGEGGTLQLELTGKKPKPGKTVLTREADEPSNVPRQKEPRALFAIWQKSVLPNGRIPGALIGKLAEAVKAYVKAKPNYDSADKLPKLLPRFDASHDWTPADVVSLLDDVAYYATDPIEALMPDSKPPAADSPKTEKQKEGADAKPPGDRETGIINQATTGGDAKSGLPVAGLGESVKWSGDLVSSVPMTWSKEQNGLRLGIRVAEDAEWRIGIFRRPRKVAEEVHDLHRREPSTHHTESCQREVSVRKC